MSEKRHFQVMGSLPPRKEHADNPSWRNWRENKTVEVLAPDAMFALQLVFEKYPDMEVHSLQHRGAIEILGLEESGRDG
jgi:hypothetical protein